MVADPERASTAGFRSLWGVVVHEAQRRLVTSQPDAVTAFLRLRPEIEEGPRVARELRIGVPCLKALEAGVACGESISRLGIAREAATAVSRTRGVIVGVESVILDALPIYLSAYIDTCRKFCEHALGQLVLDDSGTRQRRDELRQWAASAKRILSTARETVAHGDTAFIAGIHEDGLWQPMLILGLAEDEWLAATFREGVRSDVERFGWRSERLFETSVLTLMSGNSQMNETAKLLRDKLGS